LQDARAQESRTPKMLGIKLSIQIEAAPQRVHPLVRSAEGF
jgi:hypothetical protein